MPNKQVSIDALPKHLHFWMCYVEGRSAPDHHHASLAAACIEADRLATVSGRRVFILERIGCVIPEVKKE
jgi:anti-sigma factor ChrR (cupin superfamily)